MKNLFILSIILLMAISAMSQPCLPQGITFTTQTQIDSFPINHPNCTEIGGYVTIQGSLPPTITNLNGLSGLTTVGGLIFTGNLAMANLTGLNNVTSIGGNLKFDFAYGIYSLTGLDNLTSIGGSLEFTATDELNSLRGLDNLTSIGSDLNCRENFSLTSLTGLGNLASIQGNLNIYENDNITSLTGLDSLVSIRGFLTVGYNPKLTSFSGLHKVTSIGGDFNCSSNYSLTSLTGLDNLTSIGGSLIMTFNMALTNLTGLNNLTSIGGDFQSVDNVTLTSLTGLDKVTSIGGTLGITQNFDLTSLTGLDNIDPASITAVAILGNDLLSYCAIKSMCSYLAGPNIIDTINANAAGCNSSKEILDSCAAMGVEPPNPLSSFTIFPNPVSSQITISTLITGDLCILDLNGQQLLQQLLTKPKTIIDVSTLASGVYFIKLIHNKTIEVGKFIKE